MKKLAVLFLTCAIATGSLFMGQANAAAPAPAPAPAPAAPAPAPADQQATGLTQQQMDQINQLFNDYYTKMNTVRQAIIAKGAQLNKLAVSPNPDRNQIEVLARAIGQLRGKLLAERAELQAKLQQMGVSPQVLHLAHSLPVPEYKIPSKFDNYYNWGGQRPGPNAVGGNPYRGGFGPGYVGTYGPIYGYGPMGMMDGWYGYGPMMMGGSPWLY